MFLTREVFAERCVKINLNMSLNLFEFLLSPGEGFLFSRLIFDGVALLAILYITIKVIIPIIRKYRFSTFIDQLCGSEPRHWFFGHLQKVSFH